MTNTLDQVLAEVAGERAKQDAKWGEQNHEYPKFYQILNEELGEVSRAWLEGDHANMREELVQSTAVLVAMIEAGDRNCWFGSPKMPADVALESDIAHDFQEAMRAKPAPLPEHGEVTLTSGELAVTITGHISAAQTRDGSWIVQVGPHTKILGYRSLADAGVGAMLNVPGTNTINLLDSQVVCPCPVVAGDALCVVDRLLPHKSHVSEAMAVVFVPYPVHSGLLRPPAIGNSNLTRFFRTAGPIEEYVVDMSRCPSVVDLDKIYLPDGPIDPGAWGAAKPTIYDTLSEIGRFSGEFTDGWNVAESAPSSQHAGYGTVFAGQVSTALCLAMSTGALEDRRKVVLALVQRGLDQIGATCDGRVLYPNGGHCQGRKALVIFAGHMMDIPAFKDPSSIIPNVFQEDLGYPEASWWFGGGWTAGWAFRKEAPFDGSMLATHPSTWGDRDAPNHDTWNWLFSYFGQVVPCQVGTALAMTLIGREREMGRMVQMVRQFMEGPPEQANSDLIAAGHSIRWGEDYAGPIGFCSTAWKLFAPK